MPRIPKPGKPAPKKAPRLSGDDRAIWAAVTAEITPMKGREPFVMEEDEAPAPARTDSGKIDTGLRRQVVPAAPVGPAAPGREMDKRTRQRFERGQMVIDARLDLHGYGQDAARERLHGFLAQAWADALRCVLVITGKGRQGEGVLKARLPDWLAERQVRHMVLDVTPARQNHGGSGAFYILLRRQRGL